MYNAKNLKSNRKFVGSMRYFLASLFVLSVFTKANSAVSNPSVSLSCFREQVVLTDPNQKRPVLVPVNEVKPFDPVVLKLTISNLSNQDIWALSPEFSPKTVLLSLRRTADGTLIQPQAESLAIPIGDYVTILPGKTYDVLLYLEELFPYGIPHGAYDVRLQYTPDYKTWVETNSISLKVAPMSEEEKKELEEVEAILAGGFAYKPEAKVEAVKLFLAKSPDSRHRNLLRLGAVSCLLTLKEFDSAGSMLDAIIADQNATSFKKNRAYWRKAHLFRKTGKCKLGEAGKCLEKSGYRYYHRDPTEPTWGHVYRGLAMSICPRQAQYALGEEIGIEVFLKNLRTEEFSMRYTRGRLYHIEMFDSDGRPVGSRISEASTKPVQSRFSLKSLKVPPRTEWPKRDSHHIVILSRGFKIEKTGTYTLIFMQPIASEGFRASWKDGFLISNAAKINIVAK